MFGHNPNQYDAIGICWKCKYDILENQESGKVYYTGPDSCSCQLARCNLCKEIDDHVEPISRYWKASSDRPVEFNPPLLVCPDCMSGFIPCADCGELVETEDEEFEFCKQCLINRRVAA